MIGELFFNSFVAFADVAKRKCLTKSPSTENPGAGLSIP
jgi:hypothetical protein